MAEKTKKTKTKGLLSRMANKMKNGKSAKTAAKKSSTKTTAKATAKTASKKPAAKTTPKKTDNLKVVKVSKNPTNTELEEVMRRLGIPSRKKK